MYKIAICDDDEVMLKKLEKQVTESFTSLMQECEIDTFKIGRDLLECIKEKRYDAIFLDIDMPDKTGIEVANIIMKDNDGNHIIFISNHEEMVYVSLRCKPLRFIRKARMDEEIDEAVEALCHQISDESRMFVVAQDSQMMHLRINNIIYIESEKHYVHIHYDECGKENAIKVRKTLNECQREFPQYNFVRIQLGFLVNLKYVENVGPENVTLMSGLKLPIGRKMVYDVKQQFLRYIRWE